MWDLDQFYAYSQDFSFDHSRCLIFVAKIASSAQENKTRSLLKIAEQMSVYEKMAVIVSDREIFIQDPGFHQLVTLTINVGKYQGLSTHSKYFIYERALQVQIRK
jgi:hypothetical protein